MARTTYDGTIIDESHRDAIKEKIRKCDTNYRARTLMETKDGGFTAVLECIQLLEQHYAVCPASWVSGCKFIFDYFHRDFPDSYEFEPMSTQIEVTYTGGKWRLLRVFRRKTMPADSNFVISYMSTAMLKRLIEQNKCFLEKRCG